MPNITNKDCEQRVEKQIKLFDVKCSGLYVSVSPKGAMFSLKYYDRKLSAQRTVPIGLYVKDTFTVVEARIKADALRSRAAGGESLVETMRKDVKQAAREERLGKTVGEVIDLYIEHIKTPELKAWGAMAPRIETWQGIEGYLNRSLRVAHGDDIASEITNDDIAELQNDIMAGEYGKPSISNARNTRNACSGMFGWAAEAGRKYVLRNPCHDLPSLPKEVARTRVLTADEIRTLWWGLERIDLPATREVALGLKLELVTLLRSKEFIGARKDEVKMLGTDEALIQIFAGRVKKRRVINQPLNSLAQEIIAELQRANKTDYLFPGHGTDGALSEKVLAKAVRGDGERVGILEFLGMAHWTPHDLRRTGSTLAGDLGFDDAEIGRCLDHRAGKNGDDQKIMTVTGDVYNHSKRLKEKRELLNALDKALRGIIGKRPAVLPGPQATLSEAA